MDKESYIEGFKEAVKIIKERHTLPCELDADLKIFIENIPNEEEGIWSNIENRFVYPDFINGVLHG